MKHAVIFAHPMARKSPAVSWIGDSFVAGEPAETAPTAGVYGTLVHP